MSDKETPLLRQYNQIKKKHPDTVLLFRLGDFFETFNEDAEITSKVCGIVLTKRNNGAAGDMPLAGFPHHQLDNYLPKLVRAGYRVAVCEQLEDPKQARGIVRRDVVEVVTPGAALYDKLLETKKNNYLVSVMFGANSQRGKLTGLACCDISTGEFFAGEFPVQQLIDVLESLAPSEILIPKNQKNELIAIFQKLSYQPALTKLEPWIFDIEFAREALKGQFKVTSLKGFGIEDFTIAVASSGAILHYIKETQQGKLSQISKISSYYPDEYMTLDFATRRNLEITFTNNQNSNEGTLISILDKTSTPMGGRLLKKWVTRPLNKLSKIHNRLEAVRNLKSNVDILNDLKNNLSQIGDIERLVSKICTQRANPRDLVSLSQSLKKVPFIKSGLLKINADLLSAISQSLDPLTVVVETIDAYLVEEPTVQLGTGGVFRTNVSEKLDEYVKAKVSGKKWVNELQETERARTGINTLKISFNNVFGYYIEISHAHKDKIPENYNRKQTLTNAERYITPELKVIETKILEADEKIIEVEQSLFAELLMKISMNTKEIQETANKLANIDCLVSYALVAEEYNYVEPEIDESDLIEITNGRHPVVERLLEIGDKFQPNDTSLDCNGEMIHIITGPNMAGKSCYLRQTALIILLGQIGSFVPAEKAKFGIIDRIFTRVGAQDNITAGESTFLIEMQEAANILNNATNRSLILLDEVGRGTATFDGISIAWAITEYIHNVIRAKTLFATHYHELNELTERYDNIANYKADVLNKEGKLIFTHKISSGGSDHSFGINVAQMAGLPEEIISRAHEIMRLIEDHNNTDDIAPEINTKQVSVHKIDTKKKTKNQDQLAIFEIKDDLLRERLQSIDINALTPMQSMQVLSELIQEAKKELRK